MNRTLYILPDLDTSLAFLYDLGTLSKKKNDIIWEFFPTVGPPPPPPFWEPLFQKFFLVFILHFRT